MSGSIDGRVRIDSSDLPEMDPAASRVRLVITRRDASNVAADTGTTRPALVAAVLFFGTMLAVLGTLVGSAIYVARSDAEVEGGMGPSVRMPADDEQESIQRGDLQLVAPLVRGGRVSRGASSSEWLGSAVPWRLLGSGHLLLVTNAHVAAPNGIADATALSVEFASGVSAPVLDVAIPSRGVIDLALMIVSTAGLSKGADFAMLTAQPEVEWADLKVGDEVVAVGSSRGYPQTQTFGRVSALRETLPGQFAPNRWIQFDATVLPGNSGGPLLRLEDGEWSWIGIVTAQGPARIGLAVHTSELLRTDFRWVRGVGPVSP